ncbi:hypothetical protein [Cupriavidus necator]|uniref:hypothetical protein n=1 Tax=Cupriavidus necator TaxID=106590 RepID=UPI00129DFB21
MTLLLAHGVRMPQVLLNKADIVSGVGLVRSRRMAHPMRRGAVDEKDRPREVLGTERRWAPAPPLLSSGSVLQGLDNATDIVDGVREAQHPQQPEQGAPAASSDPNDGHDSRDSTDRSSDYHEH